LFSVTPFSVRTTSTEQCARRYGHRHAAGRFALDNDGDDSKKFG
jgi:hypothetical protein